MLVIFFAGDTLFRTNKKLSAVQKVKKKIGMADFWYKTNKITFIKIR